MAYTTVQIIPNTFIPSSVGALFVAPNGSTVSIKTIEVMNTDASNTHTINIYVSGNAGVPAAYDLLETKTLAPNESYVVYKARDLVLQAAQTIQAQADTDSIVAIKGSGLVIT